MNSMNHELPLKPGAEANGGYAPQPLPSATGNLIWTLCGSLLWLIKMPSAMHRYETITRQCVQSQLWEPFSNSCQE